MSEKNVVFTTFHASCCGKKLVDSLTTHCIPLLVQWVGQWGTVKGTYADFLSCQNHAEVQI